jgi:hypothetical protein
MQTGKLEIESVSFIPPARHTQKPSADCLNRLMEVPWARGCKYLGSVLQVDGWLGSGQALSCEAESQH